MLAPAIPAVGNRQASGLMLQAPIMESTEYGDELTKIGEDADEVVNNKMRPRSSRECLLKILRDLGWKAACAVPCRGSGASEPRSAGAAAPPALLFAQMRAHWFSQMPALLFSQTPALLFAQMPVRWICDSSQYSSESNSWISWQLREVALQRAIILQICFHCKRWA